MQINFWKALNLNAIKQIQGIDWVLNIAIKIAEWYTNIIHMEKRK